VAATASVHTAADEVLATAIGSSDEVDKLPDTSGDDGDVSAATMVFSGWLAADIVWVVVVAVSAAAESEVDVDSEVTAATALLLDLLQPNTIMILLVFLFLLDK
jgi:hypothetical protein